VEKRHEIWYRECNDLYRSGLFKTVTWELTMYKLDLMGVQEGRWDKGGTVRPGDYIFLYGKGN